MTTKKYTRCILKTPDGILCKDKKIRSFLMFGTPSWTCKLFKREGWARRAANRLFLKDWTIVFLYEGDSIDASGQVTRADQVRGTLQITRTTKNYENYPQNH
jgi:hypothetical protein